MKPIVAALLAAAVLAGTSSPARGIELALQAFTFRDRSFTETVETAKRLGIRHIEAYPGQRLGGGFEGTTDYRAMSPETREKLKAYLEAEGVRMVAYGVVNAKDDAEWRKLMEFAKFMGVGVIQTEVGDPARIDLGEKHAGESGIKVALHNHRQPAGRPEAMLAQLEGRAPHIGAGPDTGHWMGMGVRPLDGVRLLKGKLVAMHLVDAEAIADTKVRCVPYGSGAGEIAAVLDELKAQGFKGFVTLEYEHMSPALETEVAACVRWFNAYRAGRLDRNGQIPADRIGALHAGFAKTGRYAGWEGVEGLAQAGLEARLAKLQMLEVVPASIKGNSAGYGNGREGPDKAFGADEKQKYCQVWEGGAFVAGSLSEPAAAVFYTISSANGPLNRAPKDWVLSGSADGVSWKELDRQSGQKFGGRFELKGFEIKQPGAFRHYKLEILAHHGNKDMEFGRFALFSAK